MNNPSPIKNWSSRKCLLLFLFVFCNTPFAQNVFVDSTYLKLPSNILRFADYLFCEKDYLRAIDEYNRYLDKIDNDTVQFKIGLAYLNMDQYSNAELSFKQLIDKPFFGNSALQQIAKTYFLSKDFSRLENFYQNIRSELKRDDEQIRCIYHFSKLYGDEIPVNKDEFLESFPVRIGHQIQNLYLQKIEMPYRSPGVAAVLSAIIPGAGKIYSAEYTDGVTSLLVTGMLSFLSYDNFKADHKFRGWLFGGLAAYFYAGNIYGSAAAAQIYNAKVTFNFVLELDASIKNQNYFLPKYDFICE